MIALYAIASFGLCSAVIGLAAAPPGAAHGWILGAAVVNAGVLALALAMVLAP